MTMLQSRLNLSTGKWKENESKQHLKLEKWKEDESKYYDQKKKKNATKVADTTCKKLVKAGNTQVKAGNTFENI